MDMISGGLIQMNAHMVSKHTADLVTAFGVIAAVLCLICLVGAIVIAEDKKMAFVFGVVMALGIAMAFAGKSIPKVKEIHACASGPVSLEKVATVYEIVKIDGKELILRER